MTVRTLSRWVAIVLLLLIASPVTAPFKVADFRPGASVFEHTFDQGGDTCVVTPDETASLAMFGIVTNAFGSDALVIPPDARPSPLAVLRL